MRPFGGEPGNSRRGRRSVVARYWLVDLQDLIRTNILQRLRDPTGPPNLYSRNLRLLAEPEVHALVSGRKITAGSRDHRVLRSVAGHYFYLCSNCISIAFVSNKFQK